MSIYEWNTTSNDHVKLEIQGQRVWFLDNDSMLVEGEKCFIFDGVKTIPIVNDAAFICFGSNYFIVAHKNFVYKIKKMDKEQKHDVICSGFKVLDQIEFQK